ncbi:hypothetical protein Nepgr_003602 [Nepenthes gracilis]|uniref:Uncharacterized protein n=1 Tax=Nepenthes gracilis TaxID=150966 RepID=A0AAD3RZT5_NEPGR|nr:hypothetical protein Nepgr_003602 [Nepenthes gracilis]
MARVGKDLRGLGVILEGSVSRLACERQRKVGELATICGELQALFRKSPLGAIDEGLCAPVSSRTGAEERGAFLLHGIVQQ